jgi:hypothetical protein
VLPSFVNQSLGGRDLDLGPTFEEQSAFLRDLDAGDALVVEGASQRARAERSVRSPKLYSAILGGDPPLSHIKPLPLFLNPGKFRVNVPGGMDIGSATIEMAMLAGIEWPARESLGVVVRRAGLRVNWNSPASNQVMVLVSNVDRKLSLAGFALCSAPPDAREMKVPAHALANVPATRMGDSDLSLGFVGLISLPRNPAKFSAPGLDGGRAMAVTVSGRSVVIQ